MRTPDLDPTLYTVPNEQGVRFEMPTKREPLPRLDALNAVFGYLWSNTNSDVQGHQTRVALALKKWEIPIKAHETIIAAVPIIREYRIRQDETGHSNMANKGELQALVNDVLAGISDFPETTDRLIQWIKIRIRRSPSTFKL